MIRRFYSTFDPKYKFKCGLEIHTQLKTKYKLFSLSPTSFNSTPNSKVSYFDLGLPGTQPKLNPEALLLGLKLSVALDCKINDFCQFDRKHYFYIDQPSGYQLTQHFHALSNDGYLTLNSKFDGVDKTINIEQIQLEQDTGKSNYLEYDKKINLDYNRANIPLVELITKPDFEDLQQIKAFLKKYQTLVKYLDICTGDLETGAIRVDVNVSVNGGNRVEIKNLGSTSEIQDAVNFEYKRQVDELKKGNVIEQETRGWKNNETVKLRSKENAIDYRYFPDPEIPKVHFDEHIHEEVKAILPKLPDQLLEELTVNYKLELKHARFLIDNLNLLDFYYQVIDQIQDVKMVNNWIFHELLGGLNKLDVEVSELSISPETFSSLMKKVINNEIILNNAKKVLSKLIEDPNLSIDNYIEENNMGVKKVGDEEVKTICQGIITNNMETVEKIKNGNKNSINFLLGLAMKQTQGQIKSSVFLNKFKQLLEL